MPGSNFKKNNLLTYQAAGVDIEKAGRLIEAIKPLAKTTRRTGVMKSIGSFGALFEIPPDRFKQPVLVASADGVGTKLKLAIDLNAHQDIGIDLVAMCANDVITLGAEPLFFLDYFATGRLNLTQATAVLSSIARGCNLAGVALVGGETAEMPGHYKRLDYDLAGFCVGAVEKTEIIDGTKVCTSDALIGLASSGVHANGFSLVRKVMEVSDAKLNQSFANKTLGETLLTPTRIYVKPLLKLFEKINVHALAHITGGGLIDNISRVLPNHTKAVINTQSWKWPEIFQWLRNHGSIALDTMWKTFNMGVGMVIFVDNNDVNRALKILSDQGEEAWQLGYVAGGEQTLPQVVIMD